MHDAAHYDSRHTHTSRYIASTAAPSHGLDLADVVKLHSTGLEGYNACFTDFYSVNALGRLIEGPITSLYDLQAAEAALQSLVFYDYVSFLTPGLYSSIGISRHENLRSEAAMEAFRTVEHSDYVLTIEQIKIDGGKIVDTNQSEKAPLIGKSLTEVGDDYLNMRKLSATSISQFPVHNKMPAYFSDPRLTHYFGDRGFTGKLYEIVNMSVLTNLKSVPGANVSVQLPLLIWILLDRAKDRTSIVEAISELRQATVEVRKQLSELDQRMQSAINQAEREEIARFYMTSFESIADWARYTNVARRQQIIYDLISVPRTFLDLAIKIFNPDWRIVSPRRMANRTVTGRVFSELLRTDTAETIMNHFLTKAEIEVLEREARATR